MASNQQAQPRAKKKRRNSSKNEEDKKLIDQALTYFFLRENEIAEGNINELNYVIETEKTYEVPRTVLRRRIKRTELTTVLKGKALEQLFQLKTNKLKERRIKGDHSLQIILWKNGWNMLLIL